MNSIGLFSTKVMSECGRENFADPKLNLIENENPGLLKKLKEFCKEVERS